MFNSIEYLYANAVYYYRRSEGFGEKVSASVATISFPLGVCMIAMNLLELYTGSLAPLARELIPAANKPYDNAAEYLFAVPIALRVHYYWLWRRTPQILARYSGLSALHQRWLVLCGFLASVIFAIACGYGRVNLIASIAIAVSILLLQQLAYIRLLCRLAEANEA